MAGTLADRMGPATREAIGSVASELWTYRVPMNADDWAGKYRIIPARGNPEPGRWSNDRTPYLREPMRMCSDPSIRQVSAMKGSQLGFTDALIFNTAAWAVDQDPGPELLILPSDRLAKRTVKVRFVPSIKATPVLAGKYRTSKAESTMEIQVFTTMDLVVCGSNSSTNVRSTPFRRVKIDEFDLCEPSTKEEATQRMAAFEHAPTLLVANGTPSFAGIGIHREVLAGDRRRYLCPCPHCGDYHEWVWENLVWSGGLQADPDEVEAKAFLRCPKCSGRIENYHKPWCLRWGCWAPDGVNVHIPDTIKAFREWTMTDEAKADHQVGFRHPALLVSGEPENPTLAHRSYRISSLASPFKTFGWVAIEFIKSGGRPDRDWVNGKLGRPWQSKGEDVTLSVVRKVAKPVEQNGYKGGEVPEDVIVLGVGLDIGADHAWMLTGGFSAKMGRQYWIETRRIEAPRGMLRALAPFLLGLSYPHAAGGTMKPLLYFVDQGHRAQEVYDLCTELGHMRAFPMKGVPATSEAVASKTFQIGSDGKPLQHSLKRILTNTNYWSEVLFARLFATAGVDRKNESAENAIQTAGMEAHTLHLPADLPEAHAQQFTSEQCVDGVWEKKPGREDNHLLDCARMLESGMVASGGMLLTPDEFMRIKGVPRANWTPPDGAAKATTAGKVAQTTAGRVFKSPGLALAERLTRKQ